MSTFGLVINQEYEPSHSLLAKDQEHSFILPVDQQPEQSSLLESFALVIEQSLMTQDRPLLKSILLNDNQILIQNSVVGLNPSKASSLLCMLEQFIYDCPNDTIRYTRWTMALLKHHLSIITANPQNRAMIQRLRKFIEKKTRSINCLSRIRRNLRATKANSEPITYEPHFHYKKIAAQSGSTVNQRVYDGQMADDDIDLQ